MRAASSRLQSGSPQACPRWPRQRIARARPPARTVPVDAAELLVAGHAAGRATDVVGADLGRRAERLERAARSRGCSPSSATVQRAAARSTVARRPPSADRRPSPRRPAPRGRRAPAPPPARAPRTARPARCAALAGESPSRASPYSCASASPNANVTASANAGPVGVRARSCSAPITAGAAAVQAALRARHVDRRALDVIGLPRPRPAGAARRRHRRDHPRRRTAAPAARARARASAAAAASRPRMSVRKPGRQQQRAAEEHERAVEHLARRRAPACSASLKRRHVARPCERASSEPSTASAISSAIVHQTPIACADLDQDRQLGDRDDDEEEDQEREHRSLHGTTRRDRAGASRGGRGPSSRTAGSRSQPDAPRSAAGCAAARRPATASGPCARRRWARHARSTISDESAKCSSERSTITSRVARSAAEIGRRRRPLVADPRPPRSRGSRSCSSNADDRAEPIAYRAVRTGPGRYHSSPWSTKKKSPRRSAT